MKLITCILLVTILSGCSTWNRNVYDNGELVSKTNYTQFCMDGKINNVYAKTENLELSIGSRESKPDPEAIEAMATSVAAKLLKVLEVVE